MRPRKAGSKIPLILLVVLLCAGAWHRCSALDAAAPENPPKITSPNDTNIPEPNSPATIPAPNDVNICDPNAAESSGDIFNRQFEPIFAEYVNQRGMVDYGKLRRHRLELKALLAELAILDSRQYRSWTKQEKIAFWINTHNIKMLDIIVDSYPIESKRFDRLWWPPNSIRHIPPRDEVGTPKWNSYKFIVMDEEFTLYEIENRFFRKESPDPRIFLALSLASLDGPPLANKPYYGKDLDKQLDEQAKRFLSTASGIRIDRQTNKVYLSVLFEPRWPWYGRQFLPDYGTDKKFKSQPPEMAAVLSFICNYLDAHDVSYLETGNYSIAFKAYDWRVNEQ